MAIFGERLPASKLARYPHMFPRDIEIWERFLQKHAEEYDAFFYDTKVGTGAEPAPGIGPNYEKMVRELSKYRIDVVGEKGTKLEVFEVKPNASASAIGQVITYVKLLTDELATDFEIVGAIVTDRELPDMQRLTADIGINYYVI